MNQRQTSALTARLLLVSSLLIFGAMRSNLLANPAPTCQDDPVADSSAFDGIRNGNFSDWKDNLPAGWDVDIGATDGARQPESRIAKGAGPSLELSGDATTRAWRFVSQSLDVKPGAVYRVIFEAKTSGLKRQGRQKNNCYLGFVPQNERGKNLSPQFWHLQSEQYQPLSQMVSVPDKATSAEIWIFLSKTGTLNVKNVKVELVRPEESFDVLVADMGRNYSFFQHKNIDWKELSNRYRKRATEAATPQKFAKVVAEMLGELNDMHTWLMLNRARYSNFKGGYEANCDFHVVAKQLVKSTPYRGLGIVGETKDGFVYLNLRTLTLPMPILTRGPLPADFTPSDKPLKEILTKISEHVDAPGMIVDIRQNGGGDERMGQKIAGMFIDQETTYAKSVFRDGDAVSDFGSPIPRIFRPTATKTFKGPVVCLVGPGTVSSAEGLAMMMKAIPNCTLVGKPTRGASGNPRPIKLPNGVEVWYSRWKSLLPDETCIEGLGIQPDIEVDHKKGSDLTFEKAIEVLKQKQKQD